ncbi:hypothetical protein HX788_25130 [Pseudomonas edaphica]|uniref:Uncharacterized protein n=1 Tax=Pseudomonas edaphica TaxID=2006980 RepID=A0A7Y8FT10_9PSED|nr:MULTISPECIES: hypothetical protein [Pseudomonas]NWC43964.1 hypothetical protein [Pseudomonas sp. IPO3747]NWE10390.1 hypothetical protein [Pseudomonas edaphica]NWE84709.1 hypothetical protein [Pseudomonas edaphica]
MNAVTSSFEQLHLQKITLLNALAGLCSFRRESPDQVLAIRFLKDRRGTSMFPITRTPYTPPSHIQHMHEAAHRAPLDREPQASHTSMSPRGKTENQADFPLVNSNTKLWASLEHRIDSDTPLRNKMDDTAGDDAEVFDPETQTWQPTQALGGGLHANLGDAYREAIDFEIKADNMGGWQRV